MTQSRAMSLVEAAANVIVGYVLAVIAQIVVFPLFGTQTAFGGSYADWLGVPRCLLGPWACVAAGV